MNALAIPADADVITVEQFLEMELPDRCEWHLHHGTVVSVTFPRYPHTRIQKNIGDLLQPLFGDTALVILELPYVLSPAEAHGADVGVLRIERDAAALATGGIVEGPPELIVEVMSRSNLPYEVDELERACLAAGCLAFWKVEPKRRTVRVGRFLDERVQHVTYGVENRIAVELLGVSAEIAVSAVFAGLG